MSHDAATIRPLVDGDLERIRDFLSCIPEGERRFFKDEAAAEGKPEVWFSEKRGRRILAVDSSGAVLGYAAVVPDVGWSSHVGEVALVVGPTSRGHGIGRELAKSILREAVGLGLKKVVVEVVAEQTSTVEMFESLGFEGEALLRDHICDRTGTLRDLIVLAYPVADHWALLRTTGIEDAVGS